MKILKKIGSVVVDILIVLVFIISVLVVVASITAKRENGQANVLGYTVNSVQTDSMAPKINEGDLVVSKLITDKNKNDIKLEEGEIVSFYTELDNGQKILITHRIYEIREAGNTRIYTTWGDNRESAPAPDTPMTINEIESVYLFKIPVMGHFIDFLRTPLGFIICLVVPLLIFICWQGYKLILLFFKSKQAELEEEAEKMKNTKSEISEEERNAIIAEYLAKQKQMADEKQEDASDGEKADAEKGDGDDKA